MKVERRDRRDGEEVTETEAAKADVPEDVEESVPEEVIPPVAKPSVDDEWLPEHELQREDAQEDVQDSNTEDVGVVMSRRRKAKGKLRMNENRTSVGNKRVPKNVDAVPAVNVALNSEEEHAKWRFVPNRRVMPTVEAVGCYYTKLFKEFVCNMTEDNDDPVSPNIQNVTFCNLVKHAQSHDVLKPIAYPSMLCGILKDILTAENIEGPAPGFITISPKLMQGTHVADIPLVTTETGGVSGSGTDETTKVMRDEIRHLDGVIQSSLARKSVLEARLRSLSGEDDPDADPAVGGSGVEALDLLF
ncbi:hypothetical protein LIER_16220 [Lithospermum erythrorhizon]|uniref:Uncharacterized protein n=1 Tax=Lithospermum erythrorhizon TaxID=34254 RepID=A0AAV3Q7E7_LITER